MTPRARHHGVAVPIIRRPRKILEANIQNAIRVWASKQPDVALFRNAQAFANIEGRKVRTGLGPGSPDLVGSLTVRAFVPTGRENSPDADWCSPRPHVARSLAIEVKRPGEEPTARQENWLETMRKKGWIVGVCRSVEDAEKLISAARRWEI